MKNMKKRSSLNLFNHIPDASLDWDQETASDSISTIPSKAYGCYAFVKGGEVMYVGSATSKNSGSGQCGLRLRLRAWKRKKKFAGCTLLCWYSDRFDALSYEYVTIKEESPTDNVKHTGVGRVYKPFWRDGWWSVSKEEMAAAKSVHGDGLHIWLNNMVDAMKVPLPYKVISKEDAIKDFRSLEADKFLMTECLPTSKAGRLSSDIYHQTNRWAVGSIREHSPVEGWASSFTRKRVMRTFLNLGYDHVNRANMRSAIAMSLRIAGQFRPSVMKAFIDHYKAENVLDCCAGWGDRLAGFYASECGTYYVGIDPNVSNHSAYAKQVDLYDGLTKGKSSELICSPIEDVVHDDWCGKFDLSMTSPPYFNLEKYSYDEGQSHVRYTTYDLWVNGFLSPFMERQRKWVKTGGVVAVCLSTKVRGNGGTFDMSESCRALADRLGMTFVRTMYYKAGINTAGRSSVEHPGNEEVLVFRNQ